MYDEDRLQRLISAHFDGELGAEERAELEAMLLSSAKARQSFLDHAEFHGLLREQALQEGGVEWLGSTIRKKPRITRFPDLRWIAAGLAACLAFALWLYPKGGKPETLADQDHTETNDEVALLGLAIDVEWGGRSFAPGAALPKGIVDIRKGTLRLDFYSGARVVLEGPAKLELISPELARLDEGKLTAKVPPPAQGFTVLNGNLRVVDRGTQFGMNATGRDNCAVHVFDGEVELQGDVPDATARKLFEGDAVNIREGKSTAIAADRNSFADPVRMLKDAARENEAKWNQWRKKSENLRRAEGLLAYFDFESFDPSNMTLPNQASGADEQSNGYVIGCEKLSGRWDQKTALGFAKSSDRVRFRMQGGSPSITCAAWVRVDSLPLYHNSLLSMAPDEIGEIHWKLDRSGRLLLGMRSAKAPVYESWERLESPVIVTARDFGRWMHLATVIDGEAGVMKHFVNGTQVAAGPMKRRVPVKLGLANLGNFDPGSPTSPGSGVVRAFNGRIDEFALFNRALSAEEIAAMR